jgi:hypothetical protein
MLPQSRHMVKTIHAALVPVALSIAALAALAQPNIPVMTERTAGLDRVTVVVDVQTSSSAARAILNAQDIRSGLRKQIADEGALYVPRERADPRTLLVDVKISCASESPVCAIAILYSRFASNRTDDRAPQLFVWLVGPSDIQGKSWQATGTQVRAYSEEGALVAARLVRKSRP